MSNIDDRKPRHREVFDTLLGEITSGRFKPGDRVPTEAELAKTFSASRTTIARAMRELKGRGLLNRQRGGGTRIAKQGGKRIALFAPFAQSAAQLGHIGGLIHAHLSDLASQRADHLRLQLIGRTDGDPLEHMLAATKALIEKDVEGVFYYPVEFPTERTDYNRIVVDRLQAAGVAVLIVDRDIVSFPDRSKFPLVTFDNRRGGYLVADHMIRRGRKRIAFIGSPYVSSAASDRMRGYCDALDDHDIAIDHSLIRTANLSDLDASFCTSLVKETNPDGIICKMDHYAAYVGRHLVEMGLKIGQDVLLAGFDDQPIAEMLPVPLTTIRFPLDPFAEVCYERLIKQIETPMIPSPGLTLIDVELMVRGSTGLDPAGSAVEKADKALV